MPKIYHTTMNAEGTIVYLVGPDLRVPIDYASVKDKEALNVSLGRLLRLLNASAEMAFPESGDLEGEGDHVEYRGIPTVMPQWLKTQFDHAERTVAGWSEGKRRAAGIG